MCFCPKHPPSTASWGHSHIFWMLLELLAQIRHSWLFGWIKAPRVGAHRLHQRCQQLKRSDWIHRELCSNREAPPNWPHFIPQGCALFQKRKQLLGCSQGPFLATRILLHHLLQKGRTRWKVGFCQATSNPVTWLNCWTDILIQRPRVTFPSISYENMSA